MDQKPQDTGVETGSREKVEVTEKQESPQLDETGLTQQARPSRKALARTFRQTGRIVSLSADVSDNVAAITESDNNLSDLLTEAGAALNRISQVLDDVGTSISTMNAVGDRVRSAVEAHVRTIDRIAEAVNDRARLFETYYTPQGNAEEERGSAGLITVCGEAIEKLGEYSAAVAELVEKLDVVSLNALLEACKADPEGPGYTIVAEHIRKVVGQTEQCARDLNDLYTIIRQDLESAGVQIETQRDRARRIDQKNRDLKQALDHDCERMSALRSEAESITGSLGWLDSGVGFTHPLPGELARTVDTIIERIGGVQATASAFADTEGRIADLADTLAESSARIMPDNTLADTLDAVIAAADDLNHACEYPADSLDQEAAESSSILEETQGLAESIRNSGEAISGLSQKTAGILEAVRTQARTLKELSESRTGHRAALQDLLAALQSSTGNSVPSGDFRAGTALSTDHIYRIADRMELAAEKLDLLAAMGQLEVHRSGESGSGFAALPGAVESVGSELRDISRNILGLETDIRLASKAFSANGSAQGKSVQESRLPILQSMSFPVPALESGAAFHGGHDTPETILSEQHRLIIALSERIGSARTAAETACDHVGTVNTVITGKRRSIGHIMTATDRISSVGSDLYPKGE